jgi:hypothetical protein
MDTDAIRARLPALIRGHVPHNVREVRCHFFDGTPMISMLGYFVDPEPFDGTVIARTNDVLVVKVGRAEFAVLDRELVTEAPDEGTDVHVTPYARRRFDGRRADTPERLTRVDPNGRSFITPLTLLGAAPAKLPIPAVRCPALKALIEVLEQVRAPDGFRCISHLLVDAGARDFRWIDPLPHDIVRTPPAIGFVVNTEKFAGHVTVLCEPAVGLHTIELRRDDELVERIDEIYIDMIGDLLEQMIDDGSWRRIHVRCL